MTLSAVISDCGKYRYLLKRKINCPVRWVKKCVFVMLNPSTADAEKDDPTIRRCISFAERESCSELSVVNLFGLRATDPMELSRHDDPIGPENYRHLILELESAQLAIAAWGSHKMADCSLARELSKLEGFKCLGKTKHGKPRHPLYVRADVEMVDL